MDLSSKTNHWMNISLCSTFFTLKPKPFVLSIYHPGKEGINGKNECGLHLVPFIIYRLHHFDPFTTKRGTFEYKKKLLRSREKYRPEGLMMS